MNKLKKIFAMSFCTVMLFALVACKGDSLVGTWSGSEDDISYTFVFEKDGKGSLDLSGVSIPFEYEVKDDEITIKMTLLGQTEEDKYQYKISKNKLTITDETNEVIELTKQK
ncbi:DUF5640 domain-containing protein [Lachnospira multipara]|uniref:DUF5640 domain-containing protein n=1 Tax=Lachnospira multipara TaxID=28051 RepID=UPI0004880408|nr:DUF5640 domain-containing protein [Lachnospira multipara]